MARLLQGALPLLLASVCLSVSTAFERLTQEPYYANVSAKALGNMKYAQNDTLDWRHKTMELAGGANFDSKRFENSIDYLENVDYDSFGNDQDAYNYAEALLVGKTCFREWVRDEPCHMRDYEVAHAAAAGNTDAEMKARDQFPLGAASHDRLQRQLKDLKRIMNKDSSTDYLRSVTLALQDNFKEMVAQAREDDKQLAALQAHFESKEFGEIFTTLKKDVMANTTTFLGVEKTEEKMREHVVNMAMERWVELEKQKSNAGELTANGWSHARWDQMMNKIPDTAKYNSRGATPVTKEHLNRFLEVLGGDTKYDQLKAKSAKYYMARANQLRHEAMAKSDSIIAYVIHKMDTGGDMKEMHKAMGHKDKMDKMLGHRE